MQPANNSAGAFGSSMSLLNFNQTPAALNSYPPMTAPNELANHTSPFMPPIPGQSAPLEQLANETAYHKSSKEKKSKDKDRSEKHHKKHKSKDKHHKKHKEKSKDKDRSSKHHAGAEDKAPVAAPIKLIIKKDRNEKDQSDDNSNGEMPKLKIVFSKTPVYSSSSGGSDRKRKQSSSREREHTKMVKLER